MAVRQGRRHRRDERREPGRRDPRIHPDHPVRAPVQSRHGGGERFRLVAVPPIGGDHDDRSAHDTAVPRPQQRVEIRRDAGAAEAVDDGRGRLFDRNLDRAMREHRSQPRQARGEREDLGVGVQYCGAHEVQVRRCMRLHRLADIAQHDDAAWPVCGRAAHDMQGLPSAASRAHHRGAQVDIAAARVRLEPAGAPSRPVRERRFQPDAELLKFVRAERLERSLCEPDEVARQPFGNGQRRGGVFAGPGDGWQRRPRQPPAVLDIVTASRQRCEAIVGTCRRRGVDDLLLCGSASRPMPSNAAVKTRSNISISLCRWVRLMRASQ